MGAPGDDCFGRGMAIDATTGVAGAGAALAASGIPPAEVYAARQDRFAREYAALHARWNLVANLRLLAFVMAAGCGIWAVRARALPLGGAALLAFVGFLVLVRHHARLGAARQRAEAARAVNEEAVWRLRRDWTRLPPRAAADAPPGHPYAHDLDLLGRASLWHLLGTDATPMGAATLRAWLLAPAAPATIRARQAGVAELAGALDLRDALQVQGRLAAGPSPDPEPFLRWAEGEPWLTRRPALLWMARLLPLAVWATLALWLTGIVTFPLWLVALFSVEIVWQSFGRRAVRLLTSVTAQEGAFRHYAGSFGVLDGASFAAPVLAALQTDLAAGGHSAYQQMRRLERIARFVIPPSAMAHGVLQRLFLWDFQVLAALGGWQATAGGRTRRWLAALGEVEALAALAGLAHAQPAWAFPAIEEEARALDATALGHPLLPDETRVANDVLVGPPGRFLLVTGSNMSGKSTLLRALGVNAVLAGAGGPVCAAALRMPPVDLWTSMRIQDSLAQGVSYYLAELQRLKAIVDAARRDGGGDGRILLYLLDEMLQGTNTAERQIAARRIIGHLVRQGAIGAVSTHDLHLADTPAMAEAARPVHFTEHFVDGPDGPAMTFDYRLRPGVATSTNALRLMAIIGLDVSE